MRSVGSSACARLGPVRVLGWVLVRCACARLGPVRVLGWVLVRCGCRKLWVGVGVAVGVGVGVGGRGCGSLGAGAGAAVCVCEWVGGCGWVWTPSVISIGLFLMEKAILARVGRCQLDVVISLLCTVR